MAYPWTCPTLSVGDQNFTSAWHELIWTQLKPPRTPRLLVTPNTVADIAKVVRFAEAEGLRIGVRGTGHTYNAPFIREGGILLDMSRFLGVSVSGERAVVGPAVQSSQLAEALGAHGRAFPSGHYAGVGIGGFTLGGGMGWNGESWGQFACFQIESAKVVTASGEIAEISASAEPDLFRLAQGAGPAFPAVLTELTVRTLPLPRAMAWSFISFPLEAAPEVAEWLKREAAEGRRNVDYILMLHAENGAGKCDALIVSFGDDEAETKKMHEGASGRSPAGRLGGVVAAPISYQTLYSDSLTGPRRSITHDTCWTSDIVEAARRISAHVRTGPCVNVSVLNFRNEPRLPSNAMMVANSGFLTFSSQWDDPALDRAGEGWVGEGARLLEPISTGCYINETDFIERPGNARRSFTADGWAAIEAGRRRYDPKQVLGPGYAA